MAYALEETPTNLKPLEGTKEVVSKKQALGIAVKSG